MTRVAFPGNGAGCGIIAARACGRNDSVSSDASAILPTPMPQSRRKCRRETWGVNCIDGEYAAKVTGQSGCVRELRSLGGSFFHRKPLHGINDDVPVSAFVGDFYRPGVPGKGKRT